MRIGQSQVAGQADAELARASAYPTIWRAKRPRECHAFSRLCPSQSETALQKGEKH